MPMRLIAAGNKGGRFQWTSPGELHLATIDEQTHAPAGVATGARPDTARCPCMRERVRQLGSRPATSMRQPRLLETLDLARGAGTTAALLQRSMPTACGHQSPQTVGPVEGTVRPDRCRRELPPRTPPQVGTVSSGVAPFGLSTNDRVDEARSDHPTWTLSTLPGWPVTSSTACRPGGTAPAVPQPREWSRFVTSSATSSRRGIRGLNRPESPGGC